MQRELNLTLTQCRRENQDILPCGYHVDRVKSYPFAITEDVLTPTTKQTALLNCTTDIKSLAQLFADKNDPAGGWYLVKEQREWLRKCLGQILIHLAEVQKDRGQTVRILEAGVASFVHHYTYLRIISDVLNELKKDLRIALTVVDKCFYPIQQIAVVEEELSRDIRSDREISIGQTRFKVSKKFLAVMDRKVRQFGIISTELAVKNLINQPDFEELGRYDIITEHFLTSVLNQRAKDEEMLAIRRTYSSVLKKGGYLLSADGATLGSHLFDHIVKVNQQCGLELVPGSPMPVWDPYGIRRELIADLVYTGEALPISLENTLSMYVRGQT